MCSSWCHGKVESFLENINMTKYPKIDLHTLYLDGRQCFYFWSYTHLNTAANPFRVLTERKTINATENSSKTFRLEGKANIYLLLL